MVSIIYHLDAYKETLNEKYQAGRRDTEGYPSFPYEKPKKTNDIDNERSTGRPSNHDDELDDDDDDDFDDDDINNYDIDGENIFQSFIED